MACNCKDENGEFSAKCLGTCKSSSIIVEDQRRAIDLEEQIHTLFARLSGDIRDLMSHHSEEITDEFIHGFRRGFNLARELYECENCS